MKVRIKRIAAVLLCMALLCGAMSVCVFAADKYDGYPLAQADTLKGKIVILDAGHGIENSGGAEGYLESEFALAEVLFVKQNLENRGAVVYLTRSTENDVYTYARMSYANNLALDEVVKKYLAQLENGNADAQNNLDEIAGLQAELQTVIDDHSRDTLYYNTPYSMSSPIKDVLRRVFEYENTPEVYENMLFISIHSNADESGTASGTTVYYMSNSFADSQNYYTNYSNEQRKINLATWLGEAVSEAGGFRNRGLALNDFYMIREHNIPGALIETAFHSNAEDRAKLSDETYRKRIANAITFAIEDYFAYYKASETITPEPEITPEPTEEPEPFYKADLDADGFVSAADSLAVLKHAAHLKRLEGRALEEADVNRDGTVDSKDALMILQYVAKLIPAENEDTYEFPVVTEAPETETPGTETTETETPGTETTETETPETETTETETPGTETTETETPETVNPETEVPETEEISAPAA